jgi:hypothetical protein
MISNIPDLISFLLHYHRHLGVPPELDPSMIPAGLPPGLALLYEKLGGWIELRDKWGRGPFSTQDKLARLSDLDLNEPLVLLAWENQGVWGACFELGTEEPSVRISEMDGTVLKEWDSLNEFLISLCLLEATWSAQNVFSTPDTFSKKMFLRELETLRIDLPYAGGPDLFSFYFIPEVDGIIGVAEDGTPHFAGYSPNLLKVVANPDQWDKL